MTDLVERMRRSARFDTPVDPRKLLAEGADEIERLRETLRWYAGDGSTYGGIEVGQRARTALGLPPDRRTGDTHDRD